MGEGGRSISCTRSKSWRIRHDIVGNRTAVVAILTLPLGLLADFLISLQMAAVVFVIGWLLLVPMIRIIGKELLQIGEPKAESTDPVERLKER